VSSSTPGNTSRLPPAGLPLLGALLLWITAGCQEKEGIRHYRVDKVPEPEAKARLLAVIFPLEQHTWFFKLVGPIETVDEHAKEFIRFVNSIRFPEGAGKPAWQLPEGWSEEPGSSDLRYATLYLGPKDRSLFLTVTRLGPQAGSLLDNINRWRRQDLGLRPISEGEIKKVAQDLKIGGREATLVKMKGPGGKKGAKGPPFPMSGHPPVGPALRPPTLGYHKPAGWKAEEVRRSTIPLDAAFEVTEGGQKARVTVLRLAGGGRDLLANVNRWRTQDLGLKPIDEGELEKSVRKTEVAGVSASLVDMAGPEGAGRKRVLGAAVPRGEWTWFITMKGPADLVEKQRPAFEAFLKSVRFDGAPGAGE
jgi:hypothetical protein